MKNHENLCENMTSPKAIYKSVSRRALCEYAGKGGSCQRTVSLNIVQIFCASQNYYRHFKNKCHSNGRYKCFYFVLTLSLNFFLIIWSCSSLLLFPSHIYFVRYLFSFLHVFLSPTIFVFIYHISCFFLYSVFSYILFPLLFTSFRLSCCLCCFLSSVW
jgi:hypothetical protein